MVINGMNPCFLSFLIPVQLMNAEKYYSVSVRIHTSPHLLQRSFLVSWKLWGISPLKRLNPP
jgi:hypothetical protein